LRRRISISIVVIIAFIAARNIKYFFGYVIFGKESWNALDDQVATNLLVYSQITLILLVSFFLFRKKVFKALGLETGFLKGLAIGLLCSLPMFIGFGIMNNFHIDIGIQGIHRDMVVAGFFEELLFRGFLFGILFYYAGWGFIPAILLPSIFFGIGHLYQAESMTDSISVFLFTFLASAGFAWFYTAWKNLWVLIFLHGFMDLAWEIFDIDTNVVGDVMINLFRFTTLGLMIFLSIKNMIKHPDLDVRGKLWINKTDK